MAYSFDGYNHLIRLMRGDVLSEVLEQFIVETKIEGAWVNGLGGATSVTLGYFNLETKEYQWKTFAETMEVLSLTGNLAFNSAGKMMFHLHGVFGDDQYKIIGGHVKDLVVGATLELFIHRSYQPIYRKPDLDTGLQLLEL